MESRFKTGNLSQGISLEYEPYRRVRMSQGHD